ncbi:hypothetical protein RTCCBAU85039_2804 [Rhizobium tibeticum]|uniref:Uncharacterized protein n=1 Tax=Rhizobium tibeticum TaxID=501024 RepID=A0A1K0J1D5_9HYPH|nr:hypothetical protein RTCCBAU85039_2804 [Rhizobium tibeticum]
MLANENSACSPRFLTRCKLPFQQNERVVRDLPDCPQRMITTNTILQIDITVELMEWMPPPDGIAMCQSDVRQNVT